MANRNKLMYNGDTFEFEVMDTLRVAFPDAVIIHDKRIYSHYLQQDTQIDVIMIYDGGVFVIEAKNWKGWIKGTYDDDKWTGKSLEAKVLTVFNPIHQNLIHVRTIRNALRRIGVNPPFFANIVVFPDGAMIKSNCSEVVNLSSLVSKVKEQFNSVDKHLMQTSIMKVLS